MADFQYIIVQAGGKGTRMGELTSNRPKCLVSIGGKPMLYSLSEGFGDDIQVIVIGDYKVEILEKYLKFFPPEFEVKIIKAKGSGTSAGVQEAIDLTKGENFVLTWSDLLFTAPIETQEISSNTIGFSNENHCRWSIYKGKIVEESNSEVQHKGIPGIFFFTEPEKLPTVPQEGEFVRFLSEIDLRLEAMEIKGIREIGSYESYRKERDSRFNSRFFNNIEIANNKVIKSNREKSFSSLMVDEINWYTFVRHNNFSHVPEIYRENPLTLEYIKGNHPYNKGNSNSLEEKETMVLSIIESLVELHGLSSAPYSRKAVEDVYIKKTLDRINKVSGILHNNSSDYFYVNGLKVINLLVDEHNKVLENLVKRLIKPIDEFKVIHGDPTFSNILIKEKKDCFPVFIDPRGYFGELKIYGDPLYDIAKLYYSAVGNYDFFNQGRFTLRTEGRDIRIKIQSEGFEHTHKIFETLYPKDIPAIKLLHALIWLSLSGYVIDDYDAVNASFFHGLELLQEVLDEYT